MVFRPEHPSPVCDPTRPEHDPAYSAACGANGLTGLERAALTALNLLGLAASPEAPASVSARVRHGA
jgi:hypothetical protein